MEIVQRIQQLIEEKYGSRGEASFAKEIGIHQVTLNNYMLGKRKVSLEIIDAILKAFPDVSAEWLLRGEENYPQEKIELPLRENEMKPRIPYDAAAGTLTDAVNGVREVDCEMIPVVSIFPKYDFTIRVTGRSMEPEYYSGDEVACKRINERSFLQWGRVHVLDTTQGVVIKRIYDDGDCIRCCSYNDEFPDFLIPKDEIRSYNLVVGSLRL